MPGRKSTSRPNQPFLLGDWYVEPAVNRITRGAEIVRVAPRALEVLLCLAERPGQVVTTRQLIDSVWKEQYVSVAALTRCIANLRKYLGDDARRPRFIENIPKRGYRLVTAPTPVSAAQVPIASDEALCWLISGKRKYVLGDGEILIGRSRDAEIRIDSSMVSRHHAKVTVSGRQAQLEDLGSKNGTAVGDRRIVAPYLLSDGDRITIGSLVLVFQVRGGQRTTETRT